MNGAAPDCNAFHLCGQLGFYRGYAHSDGLEAQQGAAGAVIRFCRDAQRVDRQAFTTVFAHATSRVCWHGEGFRGARWAAIAAVRTTSGVRQRPYSTGARGPARAMARDCCGPGGECVRTTSMGIHWRRSTAGVITRWR